MISKYSLGKKTLKRRQAGSCSSQGVEGPRICPPSAEDSRFLGGLQPGAASPALGLRGEVAQVPSGELREVPERDFSSAYPVSPALIWEAGGERGKEGEEKDGVEDLWGGAGMAPTLMGQSDRGTEGGELQGLSALWDFGT